VDRTLHTFCAAASVRTPDKYVAVLVELAPRQGAYPKSDYIEQFYQ
jgi:hypothetical protein